MALGGGSGHHHKISTHIESSVILDPLAAPPFAGLVRKVAAVDGRTVCWRWRWWEWWVRWRWWEAAMSCRGGGKGGGWGEGGGGRRRRRLWWRWGWHGGSGGHSGSGGGGVGGGGGQGGQPIDLLVRHTLARVAAALAAMATRTVLSQRVRLPFQKLLQLPHSSRIKEGAALNNGRHEKIEEPQRATTGTSQTGQ